MAETTEVRPGTILSFGNPTFLSAKKVELIFDTIEGAKLNSPARALRFLTLAAQAFAEHGLVGVERMAKYAAKERIAAAEIDRIAELSADLALVPNAGFDFPPTFFALFLPRVSERRQELKTEVTA